jgi:ABC-2 type transport system permease protein
MLYRLLCLIRKELQALLNNKQGRMLLIMPVILQTAIFPFAATLEVRNSSLAIYDEDGSARSIELVQRLSQASAFSQIVSIHDAPALQKAIDEQQVLLAVHIPADFSRRLLLGQTTGVQLLVDGRRSNSGQIAAGYASQIIQQYQKESVGEPPATLLVRHLYNPNLEFKWHVLPSLVAIITTIGCLIVTALSVAREREEGTFDQLLVSPLTPAYIMAGKAIPGMLVAFMQGGFIALVAHFLYGVPFTGSLPALISGMLAYGLALAGIGLFISSLCTNQQQAFLGVFCFMVPAVNLSGYVAPIENMPLIFQGLAHINPLTYFILLLKGVFLKGFGLAECWPQLWPLLLFSLCTLSLALRLFRRHIA